MAPADGVTGGGGSGAALGNDRPADDLGDDISAAWDALENGDGDGGDSGLGDGGTATRETREPQGARDGQQAQTTDDKTDRGDGRTRKGRFAPKDGDQQILDPAAKGADSAAAAKVPGENERIGDSTNAPHSFSIRSKSQWQAFRQAYPDIAADIAKRETETAQGLAALRDYKDIAPYAQQARESGTTLSAALQRYTTLENTARRNPANGIIAVCAGLGLQQSDAAAVCLRAAQMLGARVGAGDRNPAPSDGQPGADRNAQQGDPFLEALRPVLAPILEKLENLEGGINHFHEADRNAREGDLDTAIVAFASDPKNIYFQDVQDTMTDLFAKGVVPRTRDARADLQVAYDKACRLHPEVSEALIEQRLSERTGQQRTREQEIADRARRASRSLTGSHAADIDHSRQPGKREELRPGQRPTDDIIDDAQAAYDQVAGSAVY